MRIVGYYNSLVRKECLKDLELGALTHINYAFLIPKEDGSVFFYDEGNVKEAVDIAHTKHKKIFVSVGGFCDQDVVLNKVFEKISADYTLSQRFVDSIIEVVKKFDFDGVDLDWEYPTEEYKKKFEFLVWVLGHLMHAKQKEFTIAVHRAVPREAKECRIVAVTDEVIKNVDWMNIMTYDATEDRTHSDLSRCKKVVEYWTKERGLSQEKIMVGAAFYARPSAKPYYKLIIEDPNNYYRDSYYNDTFNGCNTIKEKTFFALHNCGGLIIWAINYDEIGLYSLLSVIKTILL